MDLLQHRSRWGGAVHFALAATSPTTGKASNTIKGIFKEHIEERVGVLKNSYLPTLSNNKAILKEPSFENAWYAVAFPWQVDGYETPLDAVLKRKQNKKNEASTTKPFATRLWGEPVVVYRDANEQLVAMADACPHRSAPLSMGTVQNGELTCIYHGWTFGANGDCVDVPTLHTVDDDGHEIGDNHNKVLSRISKTNCGNHRAVVEHEGMVYIWRGNVLEADTSLLPTRRKGDMETIPIDTVLGKYSAFIPKGNLTNFKLHLAHLNS